MLGEPYGSRPRPDPDRPVHTLDIDHLTKAYGGTPAVTDLTFTVEPGRVTGFLGPNGAGKSTTMKVLLDLASADAGTATIGGRRYRDLDDPAGTVGVILEPDAFHPARTGRNHLRVVCDGAGFPHARVDEVLGLVGLADAADRRAGGYSMGMRQRLGLAAALLGEPDVLVLDEPANGLDPQGMRWLRDLLRWLADEGRTVFVSSHLLAEMEQLADEVVVINRGRLVTTGRVAELRQSGTVVRSPDLSRLADALEQAGAEVVRRPDDSLVVHGVETAEVGDTAHRLGVPLHELSDQVGSLEELFLGLTDDRAAPAGATATEVHP